MLVFAWICWFALLIYGAIRAVMFVGYAIGRGNPDAYNKDASFLKFRLINTLLKTTIFVFLSILIFGGYLS